MPNVDNRTTKMNLPLPAATNTIDFDVLRLIDAFNAIDNALGGILNNTALTGVPVAPTAAPGTSTTQLATTAFVAAALAALVNAAPGALNTLKELADAIGDDANFAATMTNALALKAPLASPALAGVPTAPTAAGGTNTTQIATTAFVSAAVSALINAAPGALDTLKELADAIGDDANFAATMTTALAAKAPLASPAFTGTPTAPTVAGTVDNTTKIATTAFVQALAALKASLTGATFTGVVECNSGGFKYPDGYTQAQAANVGAFTITDAAGAAIDPRNGKVQAWTLGANRTPVAANWRDGDEVLLLVTGAGFSLTWTTVGVVWLGGTMPSLFGAGVTPIKLVRSGGTIYGKLDVHVSPDLTLVGIATASGALAGASTTTVTLGLTALTGGIATAAAIGDIVVVAVAADGNSTFSMAMSTSGYSAPLATQQANNGGGMDTSLLFAYKILTAADASAVATISNGFSSGNYTATAYVLRNVNATPMDATPVGAVITNSGLANAPAITPVTAGTVIMVICAAGLTTSSGTALVSSGLSNVTTLKASTLLMNVGLLFRPLATYDPPACTASGWTDGTSYSSAAITLCLRAA